MSDYYNPAEKIATDAYKLQRYAEEIEQLRANLRQSEDRAMKWAERAGEAEADVKCLRAELEQVKRERDELRRSIAEAEGYDTETWPTHGNVPLAIASAYVLRRSERDRALAALRACRDAWNPLRMDMTVSVGHRSAMRGVWFRGGDAVALVQAMDAALAQTDAVLGDE